MTMRPSAATAPLAPALTGTKRKVNWADLYREVVQNDVCSGCAACVITCPRSVLGYHGTRPFQKDELSDPGYCHFGEAGCDVCTRACPRFHFDFGAVDQALFGRRRKSSEVAGVYSEAVALRSVSTGPRSQAQDGGLVSAVLVWALETGRIDGAVVAGPYPDRPLRALPLIAETPEAILASAGSRYTYVPNLLALADASPDRRLAFVGVGCQISGLVAGQQAKLKRFRSIVFRIGLMCSETFSEEPFLDGLLQARLGLDLARVHKVNVKGKLIVSTDSGNHGALAHGPVEGSKARISDQGRIEIPLSEARPLARSQCQWCSDFSAEWSDLSAGGLGIDGWTVALVRTQAGADWVASMQDDGILEARDLGELGNARQLMQRLATAQRDRPRRTLAALQRPVMTGYDGTEVLAPGTADPAASSNA